MEYENILHEARGLQPWLVQSRRELHRRAETGFGLEKTLDFVRRSLEEMGIRPQSCGKAGLRAEIGGGERCVLLRADMDALPIKERSGEDFACTGDACHACGHDMHTAMLLGAAKLLKCREGSLGGRVRFMFQPAEELLEGAKDMLSDGILSPPRPIAAAMLHVMTAVPYPCGSILLPKAGVSAPGADFFRLELRGASAHGSAPEQGRNTVMAAAQILTAWQNIKAAELPASARAALSVGSIHAGEAANVIPEKLVMEGSLRAFDEGHREYMKQRLEQISAGIAGAYRLEYGLDFVRGCPGLLIDGPVRALAASCGGEIQLIDAPQASSGSEDFAYVSREVPGVMAAISAGCSADGYVHPLHHPAVRFDEAALPVGAAFLARFAIKALRA